MERFNISKKLSLYLIIDRPSCMGRDIFYVLDKAIKGGVTIVQLREKEIDGREYVELGKKIKNFLKKFNIPLIINDRVDVAMAIEADGVHVGQEDIHPLDIRNFAGKNIIIGLSINTIEHALEANTLDIDYVGIGPVFKTATKKDPKPTLYIKGLKTILKHIRKPAVGIGGITPENCIDVIMAGCEGVAVVSAICGAYDPYLTAKKIKEQIDLAKKKIANSS
jgi:thiamine-phosphate pyrophosphorylase